MSAATARPVVVGIDGSPASLAAIALAVREATLRGRPIRLVHADFGTAHPGWVDTDPGGALAHELGLNPEQTVKEAVESACAEATTAVTAEIVVGEPSAVLVRESRTAELLIVGHRGTGGFLGLLLGSVAMKVAAHARCPVLIARGTPQPDGCVLLGVDGSAANSPAVGFAFEEAALRRVDLLALHSWTGPLSAGPGDMLPLVYDAALVEAQEADLLTDALRGWPQRYPQVRVRRQVLRSRAPSALVTASGQAQLVVVGARGRGGRPGLPFGSVTHALLHHANCPVVVVRPNTD